MVNVLVVDDHIAVTEGTKAILETCNDIFVDTLSPPFSIDLIKDKDYAKYDVILMDINLGLDQNGIEVSKLILKDQPDYTLPQLLWIVYRLMELISTQHSKAATSSSQQTDRKSQFTQNVNKGTGSLSHSNGVFDNIGTGTSPPTGTTSH